MVTRVMDHSAIYLKIILINLLDIYTKVYNKMYLFGVRVKFSKRLHGV